MERRDPRKDVCDALASDLAGDGLRALSRFQFSGLVWQGLALAGPTPEEAARRLLQKVRGGEPVPIGIWKPTTHDGTIVFERDPNAHRSEWWAPHRTLVPKDAASVRRIAFLGESTAAGWFYAPELTPAKVLAAELSARAGDGEYEVVDLAAVNLQAGALLELAAASLQLRPDLLLVFAGNNWSVPLASSDEAPTTVPLHAALALRENGPAGLRQLSEDLTRRSVEATVATLAHLARGAGVPLVLVVPEVNLADWRRDRPVMWLPRGGSAEWHEHHRQAAACLAAGDAEGALAHTNAMRTRDDGTCSTSWRVEAEALAVLGRHDAAAVAWRQAVDARAWDNVPTLPSATTAVALSMRRVAARLEVPFVDLPRLFTAVTPPGRRLFLDYCHLTALGMSRAMAAAAAAVRRLEGDEGTDTAPRGSLEAAPATEARARFLSAVYGTHYGASLDAHDGVSLGGPDSPTRAWLLSALADIGTADIARAFTETRAAPRAAAELSLAQQRFQEMASGLEESAIAWTIDPELIEAIAAGRGGGLAARVAARHQPQEERPVELTGAAYHWSFADRFQAGGLARARAFYRAVWPESHFCLPLDAPRAVLLSLTARLPRIAGPRRGRVAVRINGRPAGEVELTEVWSRHSLLVEGSSLRAGFNRVTLEWPALPPDGDTALADIVGRLERAQPVDLHPAFGELYRFRVALQPARGPIPRPPVS